MKRVSILIIFLLSLSIVSAASFDDFEESYNVGDILTISGSGEGTSVDLTLYCDEDNIDSWDADIEEGLFNQEVELTDHMVGTDMTGTCYIAANIDGDISNSDAFEVVDGGSAAVEETLTETTTTEIVAPIVENTIVITSNLNKNIYIPGDKLVVSGSADNKNADIIVEIDGKQLVSRESNFKIEYILPKDMKSGEHSLLVKAKDDYGNYGEMTLTYNVQSVPTSLELNVGSKYDPGTVVQLVANAYDQAGDLMSGQYTTYVYDGRTEILNEQHNLGEEVGLQLGEFAKPGLRKIKVVAFGLTKEQEFSVNEIKNLDISLNGDELVIRNSGNVNFEEKLIIKGNELVRYKNLNLGLGEVKEVDLSSLFYEGVYNVEIPLTGQIFNSVSVDKEGIFGTLGNRFSGITGFAVYNAKKVYSGYGDFIIGGLILFVIVLFLLNLDFKRRSISGARNKEYLRGQKRLKELQSMPKRSERYDYRKATSEDVEYFKNNVVNSYNETEKQDHRNKVYNKPGDYSRIRSGSSANSPRNEPPSNGGGLFNMFK